MHADLCFQRYIFCLQALAEAEAELAAAGADQLALERQDSAHELDDTRSISPNFRRSQSAGSNSSRSSCRCSRQCSGWDALNLSVLFGTSLQLTSWWCCLLWVTCSLACVVGVVSSFCKSAAWPVSTLTELHSMACVCTERCLPVPRVCEGACTVQGPQPGSRPCGTA